MLSMLFLLSAAASAQDMVYSETTDDYPFTVSLGLEFNGRVVGTCTGSLITPEIILTAAHCGSDYPMDVVTQFGRAFFGSSIYAATTVGFADGWFHPDYVPLDNGSSTSSTLGRNDIGILVLDEPVDFVDPIWIATDPIDDIARGATVTSIGFGVDERGNSGVKRASDLIVDRLDSTFLYSDSSTNEGGSNVCSGDSGGPQVYWDGEQYIQWAVHSWADQDCMYQSGSTRVDTTSEWILDQVEIVHGSRDRCEVWGRYGDNVCDTDCVIFDPDCAGFSSVREKKGGCSQAPVSAPGHRAFWPLVFALCGLVRRHRRP